MRFHVLLCTCLILYLNVIPALAQTTTSSLPTTSATPPTAPSITVSTDKSSYVAGDNIVISGHVQSVVPGTPLTIQILDPNTNLIQVAQIDIASDGKYTKSFLASGPLWKSNGAYTIKVQYGLPNVTAQSTFTFQSSVVPISNIFQVKDPNSGQTFAVNYTISGGTLNNISIDQSQISLMVSINSTQDGSVQLRIPRALVDAKSESTDIPFLSLIGGSEVKVQDVSSDSEHRIISIPFQQGDQQIQVIGTQIIPEFGNTVMIVLLVSIGAIILISKRQMLVF